MEDELTLNRVIRVGFTEKVTCDKYSKEMMEPVRPISGGGAFQAEGAAGAMALRPAAFEELQGGGCGWAAVGRGGEQWEVKTMCGWVLSELCFKESAKERINVDET